MRHIFSGYQGCTKGHMAEDFAVSKARGYLSSKVHTQSVWERVTVVQTERSKVLIYKAQRAEAVRRRDEAQQEINEIDRKMREAGW